MYTVEQVAQKYVEINPTEFSLTGVAGMYAKVADNLNNPGPDGIIYRLCYNNDNPTTRKVVKALTGIDLTGTMGERNLILDKWAGITPERRASILSEQSAAQEAAREERKRKEKENEKNNILEEMRLVLVRTSDDKIVAGKDYINSRIEQGWKYVKLDSVKAASCGHKGSLFGLVSPDNSTFSRLPKLVSKKYVEKVLGLKAIENWWYAYGV